MAEIRMPATPPTAYNPKRPANGLLLTQARELEKAVAKAGRRVRRQKPVTEGQVAAYMRHLNRALHQQILLPKMKRRPLDVPLDGRSTTPARAKARKPSRKRAASRGPRTKKTGARKRSRRS